MNIFSKALAFFLTMAMLAWAVCPFCAAETPEPAKYIKWIDFTPSFRAMYDALEYDTKSFGTDAHINWTELLAGLAAANGGDFSSYSKAKLESTAKKLAAGGDTAAEITGKKLYPYYAKAYSAVLGGIAGEYTAEIRNDDGSITLTPGYGLRAFSPIAAGYYYNDYDDFGASRSYGFKRKHLGHDLLGNVGTPIAAVEGGIVEACGWNQFGGWRIGIRSFDGTRYWYYAHLRKNHPYTDMYEGKAVAAGEIIGYLGMTGYSSKENTNNISSPHLHIGLQIIFDKSQKDGNNQIWVDLYEITKLLSRSRVKAYKSADGGEYYSKISYMIPDFPD